MKQRERIYRMSRKVAQFEAGILELRRYLTSPKFWTDSTVQVQDILNRLYEIESRATVADFETVTQDEITEFFEKGGSK